MTDNWLASAIRARRVRGPEDPAYLRVNEVALPSLATDDVRIQASFTMPVGTGVPVMPRKSRANV